MLLCLYSPQAQGILGIMTDRESGSKQGIVNNLIVSLTKNEKLKMEL